MSNRRMLESDLCDSLAAAAQRSGWTVYPETWNWDLLLAKRMLDVNGVFEDVQIGVQAKVRINLAVLKQALPHWGAARSGPRYRAVLVSNPWGAEDVCQRLKLWLFGRMERRMVRWGPQAKEMEDGHGVALLLGRIPDYEWPGEPMLLPPIVPSGSGGVPCPSPLSKWKLGALRLLALATARPPITSRDAKACGVDLELFIKKQWLVRDGAVGRLYAYRIGDPDPARADKRHPTEFLQILKEVSCTLSPSANPGPG